MEMCYKTPPHTLFLSLISTYTHVYDEYTEYIYICTFIYIYAKATGVYFPHSDLYLANPETTGESERPQDRTVTASIFIMRP